MSVCEKCAKVYPDGEDHETCPQCDGPLVEYDQALENAQDQLDEENILERFLEMLTDMESLGEDRPWYVPTLNTIGYNSPNIGCSVRLNIPYFTSPEITRKWLVDLKENQGYGEIFQWVKCPECDWDVPQSEITIDGHCFFCLKRKKAEAKQEG